MPSSRSAPSTSCWARWTARPARPGGGRWRIGREAATRTAEERRTRGGRRRMPDLVLSEFAGVGMPDWIDALIRMVFIVALLTVNALGLIYLERKVMARFQARVGPTRTGPLGLLQSVADAIKLVGKEDVR